MNQALITLFDAALATGCEAVCWESRAPGAESALRDWNAVHQLPLVEHTVPSCGRVLVVYASQQHADRIVSVYLVEAA